MKRDMDLVRAILLTVEDADGDLDGSDLVEISGSRERMVFHVELLEAHGLLRASVRRVTGPLVASVTVRGLTWEGYDYLDAIMSDRVWSRAREAIARELGGASLSIVRTVCERCAVSLAVKALEL